MKQQLEDDLCRHLRERVRHAVEDHLDTCHRVDVDYGTSLRIAIATLMAEAIAYMRVDGGDEDDMLQVITFVKQKMIEAQRT